MWFSSSYVYNPNILTHDSSLLSKCFVLDSEWIVMTYKYVRFTMVYGFFFFWGGYDDKLFTRFIVEKNASIFKLEDGLMKEIESSWYFWKVKIENPQYFSK